MIALRMCSVRRVREHATCIFSSPILSARLVSSDIRSVILILPWNLSLQTPALLCDFGISVRGATCKSEHGHRSICRLSACHTKGKLHTRHLLSSAICISVPCGLCRQPIFHGLLRLLRSPTGQPGFLEADMELHDRHGLRSHPRDCWLCCAFTSTPQSIQRWSIPYVIIYDLR